MQRKQCDRLGEARSKQKDIHLQSRARRTTVRKIFMSSPARAEGYDTPAKIQQPYVNTKAARTKGQRVD